MQYPDNEVLLGFWFRLRVMYWVVKLCFKLLEQCPLDIDSYPLDSRQILFCVQCILSEESPIVHEQPNVSPKGHKNEIILTSTSFSFWRNESISLMRCSFSRLNVKTSCSSLSIKVYFTLLSFFSTSISTLNF